MANKIEMVVRHYVKKFLAEVVSDLDQLIERKIDKQFDLKFALLQESKTSLKDQLFTEASPPSFSSAPKRKKITPESLGIRDETWKEIYTDIDDKPYEVEEGVVESTNPLKPELVPEDVLLESGLVRDFSKHMQAFKKMDQSKQVDASAEEKHREILRKFIR